MIQQRGGRPYTIIATFTVLAKDKKGAREFAKEVRHYLRRRVGDGGAVVISDTVRCEIEEELEIYASDFEGTATSRKVG